MVGYKTMKKKKNNKINNSGKKKKIIKTVAIAGGATMLAINVLSSDSFKAKEIGYPQFEKLVDKNSIEEIRFSNSNETLYITDKDGNIFKTVSPGYENFRKDHLDKGIKFSEDKSISLSTAVIIGVNLAIFAKLSENMNLGKKSSKKLGKDDIPKDTFEEIVGLDDEKKELQLAIKYLENPTQFESVGAKMSNGILFYGPPGTGKTKLAKAVAGTAKVPFFSISGSEFVELYAGMGARKVRSLFKEARKNAPCVIFIDEIDAIGKKRSDAGSGGADSERDQTLNELLKQLDGFENNEGILVISATNRIETLDPALIRPKRFGKHIKIATPKNKEERLKILELYASNKTVDDGVLEHMARTSLGFSGAELESYMNDCALTQIMEGKDSIDLGIAESALFKILTKGSKIHSKERKDMDNKITSWHEAGHALSSYLCGEEVLQVTITGSSSGIGGFSLSVDDEDSHVKLSDLRNRVKVLYSGIIAESFILGEDITTGACSDIEKASKIISDMIIEYGMNKDRSLLNLKVIKDEEQLKREAKALSEELYSEALDDLTKNKDILENIANALLEKETLYDTDINEIVSNHKDVTLAY